MRVVSLSFGTSGLRGLAADLMGPPAYSHTVAFLRRMQARYGVAADGVVLLGRDLRESSPGIEQICRAALEDWGMQAVLCGELPTPALALQAMGRSSPAIMVTGSHIPSDRNGLKFYRPDGEIDKDDEAAITGMERGVANGLRLKRPAESPQARTESAAVDAYLERFVGTFPRDCLKGMRIGVFAHSSVSRDLIGICLRSLSAETMELGRSASFVAVDTESIPEEQRGQLAAWSRQHRLDAIVSADGDGDRPLIVTNSGILLRGDLVGAICAGFLGADCVVTPVTANSGIERSGRFRRVVRTRVGSPYVIEGMERAGEAAAVVGFEPNGGVLVGRGAHVFGRTLSPLPTRDALIVILSTLASVNAAGTALDEQAGLFDFTPAASGKIKTSSAAAAKEFVSRLARDRAFRTAIIAGAIEEVEMDLTDGTRLVGRGGQQIHFRASGNAPELRCYVEAETEAAARSRLERCLTDAEAYLGKQP